VVHHHEQRAGEEGVLSMAMVVAREILQEAVEPICAPLGELLGGEGRWRPPGGNGPMQDTHKEPRYDSVNTHQERGYVHGRGRRIKSNKS
jgi:hypothetical protein